MIIYLLYPISPEEVIKSDFYSFLYEFIFTGPAFLLLAAIAMINFCKIRKITFAFSIIQLV